MRILSGFRTGIFLNRSDCQVFLLFRHDANPGGRMMSRWHFKWALSGLALTCLTPVGHADEACESFIETTLDQMFSSINRAPEPDDAELKTLVRTNVDTLSIARFTLGKYAARVKAADLTQYSQSLNAYFLETIYDNVAGGHRLSADVLKSFDRTHRDCLVETVIHRDALEDLTVIWRVMRVGDHHQILDMAIDKNGNTIWLAIELRAQVMDLYERSNGDLRSVIEKLGFG